MTIEKWVNRDADVFVKVKKIVNKHDLADLLNGAPDDEYENEIVDILNRCSHITDENEMSCILKGIFDYWFDENGYDDSKIPSLAKELSSVFNNVE